MQGITERLTQVKNNLTFDELGFTLKDRTLIGINAPTTEMFEHIVKYIATTLLSMQSINKVLVSANTIINGLVTETLDVNNIDVRSLYILTRGENISPNMRYVLVDERATGDDIKEQLHYSVVKLGRTKNTIERQWHESMYMCFNDIVDLKNTAFVHKNQCLVVDHCSNTCTYRDY